MGDDDNASAVSRKRWCLHPGSTSISKILTLSAQATGGVGRALCEHGRVEVFWRTPSTAAVAEGCARTFARQLRTTGLSSSPPQQQDRALRASARGPLPFFTARPHNSSLLLSISSPTAAPRSRRSPSASFISCRPQNSHLRLQPILSTSSTTLRFRLCPPYSALVNSC